MMGIIETFGNQSEKGMLERPGSTSSQQRIAGNLSELEKQETGYLPGYMEFRVFVSN